MKPAAFDYVRPDNVAEALAALAETGDEARLLAGGQSLLSILNMRLAKPERLIDISRLEELRYIREIDGALEIGAAVTQGELESWSGLACKVPLLARALPYVGHFQTRNKGTVCGSIALADPSAELPLCLAALNGTVVLRSSRGERVLAAQDFQTGMLTTARAADEMIVAVRYPACRPGAGHVFAEMALRHGDFAICAVAVAVGPNGVRIAIGGVADRPAVRDWPDLSGSALSDALNDLAWELNAGDDHVASATYRRELVRRLGAQSIAEAKTCQF